MKNARTKTEKKPTPTQIRASEFRRSVNGLSHDEANYRLQQANLVIGERTANIAVLEANLKLEREALATASMQAAVLSQIVEERR